MGRRGHVGPLRRGDAAAVVEQLNSRLGCGLVLLDMAAHGDLGGAAFVRWPDGRDGVLVRNRETVEHLERVAALLELVNTRGVRAPRYDLIAELSDCRVVVQERLHGAPAARLDRQRMDAILAVNESFSGALADRPEVPPPDLSLGTRLARSGVPARASLETFDARSRRLLRRILQIERNDHAAAADADAGDLVHRDFTPGNILFDDDGELTGLVDWHDTGTLTRGDRRLSLVILRFDIGRGMALDPAGQHGWSNVDPDSVQRLDDALDAIDDALLRLYWAQQSLITVDAVIRTRPAAEVAHQLAIAESRL